MGYILHMYEFHTFYFFIWNSLDMSIEDNAIVFIRKDCDEVYIVSYDNRDEVDYNVGLMTDLLKNSKPIEMTLNMNKVLKLREILKKIKYSKDVYSILKESDKAYLSM